MPSMSARYTAALLDQLGPYKGLGSVGHPVPQHHVMGDAGVTSGQGTLL